MSIAPIILIDFVFSDTPEIFNGGYKLGVIIENLSLSYIAGFIFYFLTVHIKEQKDKRHYGEIVGRLTSNIISGADYMVGEIINYKRENKVGYDQTLIYNACCSINPANKDAINWVDGTTGDWLDYLYHYFLEVKSNIKDLNDRLIYLEPEHSKLIARIEDSLLLKQINAIYHTPSMISNNNLAIFSTSIINYMNLIDDLEKYTNKNLSHYKGITAESVGYRRE
jgi:hypothetical protein